MTTKDALPLFGSDHGDDLHSLFDAERNTPTLPSECPETPSFDAELPADVFDLTRRRTQIAGDMGRVDANRSVSPVIHNAFWIVGKVPSLNDLLEARGAMAPVIRSIIMRRKPSTSKSRGHRFDLYNDIKQDWKHRTIRAVGSPFVRVTSCYFGYVIVEETLKRDPSNVSSAAIKFIEDGLKEAGVIPNDGWKNVLGIRMVCVHRIGREPGVYVVMSDCRVDEDQLVTEYEEHHQSQ